MTWEELSAGLAISLSRLPAGALFVVTEPGGETGGVRYYFQFIQSETELSAFLVGNVQLSPARQASAEGEALIESLGWRPPHTDMPDWSRELPWPSNMTGYTALSDAIVSALRDGYGISAPEGWLYRAWNERNGVDLELTQLGLPAE